MDRMSNFLVGPRQHLGRSMILRESDSDGAITMLTSAYSAKSHSSCCGCSRAWRVIRAALPNRATLSRMNAGGVSEYADLR